jgi:hypothetical protein
MSESGRKRGRWTFELFGRRWGFEHSPIIHDGSLYMDRWILYVAGCTLRLHHIMRPDLARSLHNHPFWFWTFPLGEYREEYWRRNPPPFDKHGYCYSRTVRAWRPQFRGIDFRHRITHLERPVWTIVITGPYRQKWGFFPTPDTFVKWDSPEAKELP